MSLEGLGKRLLRLEQSTFPVEYESDGFLEEMRACAERMNFVLDWPDGTKQRIVLDENGETQFSEIILKKV